MSDPTPVPLDEPYDFGPYKVGDDGHILACLFEAVKLKLISGFRFRGESAHSKWCVFDNPDSQHPVTYFTTNKVILDWLRTLPMGDDS